MKIISLFIQSKMPSCPTCGKKIALSWQMEKHQKSSRCKLFVKTKELERVNGDLHIMCGNVEKLQAALIALEKEHKSSRFQPLSHSDTEAQESMKKIMDKLQEICDLIKILKLKSSILPIYFRIIFLFFPKQ